VYGAAEFRLPEDELKQVRKMMRAKGWQSQLNDANHTGKDGRLAYSGGEGIFVRHALAHRTLEHHQHFPNGFIPSSVCRVAIIFLHGYTLAILMIHLN